MRPRILLWVVITAGLLCVAPARASVWFSSAPSSAQSGNSYYVEASASGGSFDLTIYKNSGYFCGTSGSGWASTGSSTTDYGAQTVEYRAETYDWYTMDYDNTYAWVSITANNAPTITWTLTPSTAYVGQQFTIEARGNDSDGNLSAVSIWKDDQPFAFAGGGNGYEGYSSNPTSGGSAGTIAFKAKSADSASAESDFIYHNVSIIKYDQTISFGHPGTQTYGSNVGLSASASSGLGVSFSVLSGPAYLSGNTLVFTGAGTVGVRASQGGDGTYHAAPDVDHSVTVNPASQSITFSQPATQTYGTNLNLSASATSGLGVSFSVLSGPAYLSGNTLVFTGGGSVTVRASQGGNADYYAAANVDRTITVNKANQTITFNQPAAQTYGGQLALGATASSGLAVSYTVISGSATISFGTITFTGVGSVTVRAAQAGDAGYNPAADVDRTITVNKASQTITFTQPAAQTYGGQLALDATASSGLAVTYSVLSGPASLSGTNLLTLTGVGSVEVRAAQGGNANYNAAANVDRTITVNKADPTATFNPRKLGTQTLTTYTVQAGDLDASFTGPAGADAPTGTVTYLQVGPGTAVIVGTVLNLGTYTIRASYPGDARYNATTTDATWIVTMDADEDGIDDYLEDQLGTDRNGGASNTEADTANQTKLQIHRPAP